MGARGEGGSLCYDTLAFLGVYILNGTVETKPKIVVGGGGGGRGKESRRDSGTMSLDACDRERCLW